MIATKSWSIQNCHWPSTIHRRRHGTIILWAQTVKAMQPEAFTKTVSGTHNVWLIWRKRSIGNCPPQAFGTDVLPTFHSLSTLYISTRLPYHTTDKHEKLDTWTDAILQWIYRSVIPASTWSATTNGEPSPRTAKHMPGYPLPTGHGLSTDKYWSRTWEQSAGQIKDLNFHTGASSITNTHSVVLVGIHVGRAHAMTHPRMVFFSPS